MFKKSKTKDDAPANLDDMITHVTVQGVEYDFNTPEFDTAVKQLERLHKLKPDNKHKHVSADALLAIGGNLLGIALILTHERAHAITTKALGFVTKIRL